MKPSLNIQEFMPTARGCAGCGENLQSPTGTARHNVRCSIDGERSYASARTQQETED